MAPAPWNEDPLPSRHQHAIFPDIKSRNEPISHPPRDAPLCPECKALDLSFFDPDCKSCCQELKGPEICVSHIFAILRQWVPQVQRNIKFLVSDALRLGCHPDDRDELTDMTLLMYVCKAGATTLGDVHEAPQITQQLIDKNADLQKRCRWTDMTPIHYATYFDAGSVLNVLLSASKGSDVDTTCHEFYNGSGLHIAATNLSVDAAQILVKFGGDLNIVDDLGRKPYECIPESSVYKDIPDSLDLIDKMKKILTKGNVVSSIYQAKRCISGKTALQALGLKVNDRVVVAGNKFGTLRFCGTTSFAPGIWVGVELDSIEEGKNDGSVNGVVYFKCKNNHGIFVTPNKISKVGKCYKGDGGGGFTASGQTHKKKNLVVDHGRVKVCHVGSRISEAFENIEESKEIRIGDKVSVSHDVLSRKPPSSSYIVNGIVRFLGTVDFVEDTNKWFGVELDENYGRHDGSVQGIRYFASHGTHGIFVTRSKLTKLKKTSLSQINLYSAMSGEIEESNFSFNYHSLNQSNSLDHREEEEEDEENHKRPVRRSLSMKHRAIKSSMDNRTSCSPTTATLTRTQSMTNKLNDWNTVGNIQYNKFKKKGMTQKFLELGDNVMCVHNKEMGSVKYIGRVEFAPGIWVGLELRNPKGRHDGTIEGKRYFTCKSNHGTMIKPKKLSCHGINAQNLLKPESEYPF